MSGIQDLAKKGRNGDNTLMHVSQDEVAGLNSLARSMAGRELTTNPETGLPEAFLFAPFLAPAVAGGLGLGGSAIATGLAAGALGAGEAELRGMDDPLRRGLYAGLTAGAASGIGNALSGAGEAGTQAATAGTPDLSASVQGAGGASTAPQMSFAQPSPGYTPPTTSATPTVAASDLGIQSTPQSLAPTTATAGSPTLNPQQAFQQSQYGDIGQMGEGIKNVFRDEAARKQFMEQVRLPATAGAVGLGGQAQMNVQDEMKERKEAADREKAAELKEAQNTIRSNYATVGRPMPTGFSGSPLFKQGGIVNLRRGGGIGAPGSDVGRGGGGRAGSGGGGSRGGGGGRDDDRGPQKATASSTQPTLPLMAERTPTPNYDEFLAQLQQGAGNRAAMQQSGYGMASGGYLDGGVLPGDGMSDDVPAMIDGDQPAALSSGEFVIPADVVSHIGNGSSDSGAKQLYAMMDRIREARTGEDDQAPKINPKKMMPK
jgi:hypothetical protein